MKIDNETKAKLFGQYYGQDVYLNKNWDADEHPRQLVPFYLSEDSVSEHLGGYLLLRPIESITDEELKEIAIIHGWPSHHTDFEERCYQFKLDMSGNENHHRYKLHCYDYLRSISIALPYMGISVEEQINLGWVKLIEK